MDDGSIKLYNITSQSLVTTLSGHSERVTSLKILNSYGSLLASGSKDRTINIWNLNTNIKIKTIPGNFFNN